jgi:lipoprotein-anchoring transpeptidase ErfK/SrfK
LGGERHLWLNSAVRLYTKYKPARRQKSPVRFFGPLVIVGLAIFWWLRWDPQKTVRTNPVVRLTNAASSRPSAPAVSKPPTANASVPPLRQPSALAPTNPASHSNFFSKATSPPTVKTTAPIPDARPTNSSGSVTGFAPRAARNVFEAQLALARQGISPGPFDGVLGSQTRAALRAFQQKESLPVTGEWDALTRPRLLLQEPPLTFYLVTTNDLARLLPLGATWLTKSQQDRLDYETVLELVAEKSRTHPGFIRQLNPTVDWTNIVAGAIVQIPNAEKPIVRDKAAFVRIHLTGRTLQVFDAETNLLTHFPCSIARQVEKRPVGDLRVSVIASNPDYTFDPDNFPESAEARQLNRKLVLKPGPNNPVGTVWIGLDRPGYGIHGTPRPEEVGRTESHGCFRLANWNAEYLKEMAWVGMPVFVEP